MSEQIPRILVVDDDEGVRKLVELILTRGGMQPILAADATEAAGFLRQKPLPNLLVLDMMMPGISGMELLTQIRAKKIFDDLPILILSALADPEQIRAGLDAGADRYLTKPYLANNLLVTVTEMLRTGRIKKNKE